MAKQIAKIFAAFRQIPQELPRSPSAGREHRWLQLAPREHERVAGEWVEVLGTMEQAPIMVPLDRPLAVLHHQPRRRARVRAIADDIAETDRLADAKLFDAMKYGLDSFKICVQVGDDCKRGHTRSFANTASIALRACSSTAKAASLSDIAIEAPAALR